MKKLIVLVLVLFASVVAKAQNVKAVPQDVRMALVLYKDAQSLLKSFTNKVSKKTEFIEEGCIRFSGKDKSAPYDITMVTSIVSKNVEIVTLKNNITNEVIAYAEDGISVYSVVKNTVIKKPFQAPTTTNKSIGDCFQQFKKGLADCPNCISCVNSCWTKNKKWKRISCAVSNCGSSCFSCITNLWGFVNCVFN
jgi:hypothetical protein